MKKPKNLSLFYSQLWDQTTKLQLHDISWYLHWRVRHTRGLIKNRFSQRLQILRQANK